MRTKHRWLALLFALALVVAACGGESAETTTTAGSDTTTTTAASGGDTTTTTAAGEEPMEIATDVGVDLDAGVIKIGMLTDLSGPFSPLTTAIFSGHEAYWASVNDAGGVNGLQVELVPCDTAYDTGQHVQCYEELKDDVVAFGHSTGSPQTVAIRQQLEDDGILAIPLTWYSGWWDPAINSNLVPHGTPYCLESMNMIEYIMGVAQAAGVENPTLAIASLPGDYGLDSMAGAKLAAEALGLEIVYDGTGTMIPTDETTLQAAANGIVESGADIVMVTGNPGAFSGVYGPAVAQGFQAVWTAAYPSWTPSFVSADSPIKDAITRDLYLGSYVAPFFADNPGSEAMRETMATYKPDLPPFDYYAEGFVEGTIMYEALLAAYAAGDLTQTGVLTAAKSLPEVDFNGLAPNETYVGTPNEIIQRQMYVTRPDPEGLAAGTSGGNVVIEENYVSEIAAAYEFSEACFKLEG